ncbi:DinB family protein [Ornithinimicrobium cavernae]|uniref:DinB family protein n=1 Tax=Ornithinimicrobium cavernae TaxID=2666047 RepID=UPI000D69AFC4|nr:DinB family protein [Ornithinimicrobium cavernae]
MTTDAQRPGASERETLVEIYDDQRHNLLIAMRGLSEEQARTRSTSSQLTLGGLLKHVTLNEQGWLRTITEADPDAEFDMAAAEHAYELTEGETFQQWLEEFAAQAARTNAFIREVPDLEALIPLPRAPWAPDPGHQSVRRILLHMFRETAHHSGHADIIREELDGASTTMTMARDAGMFDQDAGMSDQERAQERDG